MKIILSDFSQNPLLFFRQLGYHPDKFQKPGSLSFSRRLGGNHYPKFHIYFQKKADGQAVLTLHLDMKKPSYKKTPAHSAEYQGELVKAEVERIKQALEKR